MTVNMLKSAQWYARHGWHVIPLHEPLLDDTGKCLGCTCEAWQRKNRQADYVCETPGKHPRMGNWEEKATTDPTQIKKWWGRWPKANVGAAMGKSGLVALDGDKYKEVYVGPDFDTETVTNLSGGGGEHWIYRHPSDGPKLGNSTGKLPPGIDVRGWGGLIVLPPSLHSSGNRYEWEEEYGPHEIDPITLPTPVRQVLTEAALKTEKTAVTLSDNGGAMSKPDLSQLKINEAMRAIIRTEPDSTNDRSRVDQCVISALIAGGHNDDEILAVFEHYKIGTHGKYAEKGKHGRQYLARSIERARAHVNGDGSNVTSPPKTTAVAVLQPKPLSEFLAQEFQPLTFLVNEILAKGHMAILAGRPKCGKSWLVLQLAQAIDQGRPFLGRETRRGGVLYIALEDGDRRVYQRCKILKWQPKAAAVLFRIANFDGDGVPGPGVSQLAELAGQFDLVIVDTMIATLSSKANENDNTQMGLIVNELARIAHDTDMAVLLVHHTGKGSADNVFDLLRGASAIRGGYDVGLLLERKQGEREAVLHMESRDVDLSSMTIQQAANGAGWECLGSGSVIHELRAGRKVVKAMLEHGDGQTAEELGGLLNITRQAAHKQLLNAEKYRYVYREQATDPDNPTKPTDLWYLSKDLGG